VDSLGAIATGQRITQGPAKARQGTFNTGTTGTTGKAKRKWITEATEKSGVFGKALKPEVFLSSGYICDFDYL
jgi:hypothetical protein